VSESIPLLKEGVRYADEASDPNLQVLGRANLVTALHWAGHLIDAVEVAQEAIELSQKDLNLGSSFFGYRPHVWILGSRAATYTEMGLYERARQDLDRALLLARQREEIVPAMVAVGNRVLLDEAIGEVSRSLGRAREAVELAEKTGNQVARSFAYRWLGRACMLTQQWDDASNALHHCLEVARGNNTGLNQEAAMLGDLARLHYELGDASKARTLAEEAIEVARQRGTDLPIPPARIVLAQALLHANDPTLAGEIEAALESAMEFVEKTGAERYRPEIHEVRAELAHLRGDEAEQRRQLREAHGLYVESGATGHAQRLATQLGLVEA
jgi:adenylate cyclase